MLSGVNGSGGKNRRAKAASTQESPYSSTQAEMAALSRTAGVVACALSVSDDLRTEKVVAIQQSIAAGTYNVSPSAVAGKLMCALLAAKRA